MRNIQLISGKNFEKFILNLNRENAEEIYPSNSRLFHKLTSPSHKEEKWKGMSEDEHDLFPNFRGIIILGRFLGLVPCSGVFYKSSKDLNCRYICIQIVWFPIIPSVNFNVFPFHQDLQLVNFGKPFVYPPSFLQCGFGYCWCNQV